MNQTKIFLGYSALLTFLYIIWLWPGYWYLGFFVINTLFLVMIWFEFKKIKEDGFLKIIVGLSFGLGMFMAIRSFWFVSFLTFVSIFILNALLVVLSKKPKAKLDINRIFRTNMAIFPLILKSIHEAVGVVLQIKNKTSEGKMEKIIKGVVLSIPLLLVFGVLFYKADPIFAKILDSIKLPKIKIDANLFGNIFNSCIFFGIVGGIFKNKLVSQIKRNNWLKSITETNVAISILEILFIAFSVVQIKYFLATAQDLKNLKIVFSEYTRSGYGQMIMASILAYLVVLRLEFSLRSQVKLGIELSKLTKFLIWSMLGEILLFIVSATKRNYIYQSFYGYTEIRLLGFAMSIWLVAMLFLLAYKVWQKKKADFFVRGIILITVISILGLNIVDIDGTIVRTKPASLDSGVDYGYMVNLSDDAWQGWEMILKNTEDKINVGSSNEYFPVVSALRYKRERLEKMAKNNWSWGGSFNYSAMKSLNYLQNNKARIEDLISKINLSTQGRSGSTMQITQMNVDCRNSIYEALNPIIGNRYGTDGLRVIIEKDRITPEEEIKMLRIMDNKNWVWVFRNEIINNKMTARYFITCR